MRLEIESAANFLSNFLRLQPNCLTGDQLDIFRETILKLLTSHYQQHWFPEKPVRGSGYRCLRINHKLDPIIAKAGTSCGLNERILRGYLPKELTLWIDPKEVSYRIGENGSICVLFNGQSDNKFNFNNENTIQLNNNCNVNNINNYKPKVQQTQSPTKASSPVPSLSSLSSNCSSTTSSLSNSPTSSLDWSHSINIESRRSPVTSKNQMASPSSIRSNNNNNNNNNNNVATGSEVTGFQRSGYTIYEADLINGHHPHQQQQHHRQGRNIERSNNWNWNSYINTSYPPQQQQQQQQQFHYARQQNIHARNVSPPLTHHHHNFSGWSNYMLDHTFNHRNHRFNTNMEQFATYVSS